MTCGFIFLQHGSHRFMWPSANERPYVFLPPIKKHFTPCISTECTVIPPYKVVEMFMQMHCDLYMKCILKAFWNCSHQIDRNAWGMHSCVHVSAGTLSAHVYACKNRAHTNFHTDCGYRKRTISHISDFCEITFPLLTVKPHHNSWSCFCSKRHFAGMICNRLKVNVTSALPQ